MKKIICIIITFAVIFGCLCTSAFSAVSIKLTEETYPTEIVKGSTFSAYGIVTSDYNISAVTLSVVNSDGETEFTYTGKPGTKTYDIHNIDYLLTFSKLDIGDYTYTITATDSQTTNAVLLSKNFKVVSSQKQTLKLTGANYPAKIVQGNTFSIYGTVSSENTITSVSCAVYSTSGALQFIKTAEPGVKSYSLSNIDKYMTFSKLTAGQYVYTVKASDTQTKDMVLLSKEFTVTSAPTGTTVHLSGANYPTTFTEGTSFSIEGIVTSDYTLSTVVIGVYSSSGTAQFQYTAKPGEKSYNIHTVDYLMTFSKLKAGTYTYRIKATDTYSKDVVLLEKSFSVIGLRTPESDMKQVKWKIVDLSKWNEFYSWDKFAAAVDGVILRIGYRATGNHSIGYDSKFLTFYQEACSRGLHVGCYFFSDALTEKQAVEEAEYVLNILKKNKCKMDMPIYFDMETDGQVALSAANATKVARAFCDTISAAGYFPGIYCNKYFARDELYASQLTDISFWIAEYGSSCTYTGPYGMWQFSEKGVVDGHYERADMNYCYYDYPAYIKAHGLNGYGSSEPITTKYEIHVKNGIAVDKTAKIISGVASGLTTDSFKNTYTSVSSNVTVAFGNTVSGKVSTGTTVTFKTADKTLDAYTVSVKGDVDSNAVINSSDALAVLEYSIGRKSLNSVKKLSADYNGDKAVNSGDALAILQYAVKIG